MAGNFKIHFMYFVLGEMGEEDIEAEPSIESIASAIWQARRLKGDIERAGNEDGLEDYIRRNGFAFPLGASGYHFITTFPIEGSERLERYLRSPG